MRVLYVQYANPGAYPPLVRGAQLLAESGVEVLMLGTRVPGLHALNVSPTSGMTVKLLPEAGDGWRLKAHYARYAAWVVRQITTWKPDWIYASDLLSTPIALGFALPGGRVVYHEHDAPVHERESWVIKRCLDARHRLLFAAAEVVAPNAERAARLSAIAGGRHVHTVWNCPRRPVVVPPRSRGLQGLRVLFRGSINANRLPLTVVDAIARVNAPVTLDVAGYETAGSRGYLGTLASHAERLGVLDRVRILGTVPDEKLVSISQQCDLGLAFMPMGSTDENMRSMTGASNKVFEYLSCGVVPVVSDLADWRAAFADAGYALVCDPANAASIATTFEWAIENRGPVTEIAERGWERLRRDWNYETQFAPVLRALGGATTALAFAVADDHKTEIECAS